MLLLKHAFHENNITAPHSTRQVKIWFQNRRARERREVAQAGPNSLAGPLALQPSLTSNQLDGSSAANIAGHPSYSPLPQSPNRANCDPSNRRPKQAADILTSEDNVFSSSQTSQFPATLPTGRTNATTLTTLTSTTATSGSPTVRRLNDQMTSSFLWSGDQDQLLPGHLEPENEDLRTAGHRNGVAGGGVATPKDGLSATDDLRDPQMPVPGATFSCLPQPSWPPDHASTAAGIMQGVSGLLYCQLLAQGLDPSVPAGGLVTRLLESALPLPLFPLQRVPSPNEIGIEPSFAANSAWPALSEAQQTSSLSVPPISTFEAKARDSRHEFGSSLSSHAYTFRDGLHQYLQQIVWLQQRQQQQQPFCHERGQQQVGHFGSPHQNQQPPNQLLLSPSTPVGWQSSCRPLSGILQSDRATTETDPSSWSRLPICRKQTHTSIPSAIAVSK